MSKDLWLSRWENKEIGFHLSDVNPYLKRYYELLKLEKNSTIFIPLCGKSIDIEFFLSKGHRVIGCEFSHLAITQFFENINAKPKITQNEKFKIYTYDNLTIFEGDFFDLDKNNIGKIDAIYDRASIVALTQETRKCYSKHIKDITNTANQLVVSCVYEQELHQRTPYSVTKNEIFCHYEKEYNIKLIESTDIKGGLKGICPAKDEVWLLERII